MLAVKMLFRQRGFTLYGPENVTTIQYVFVHGGVAYVIDFHSSDRYLARYLPSLTHAIATMRFPQIA